MVAIVVTENPAPQLQLWDRPEVHGAGIPIGSLVFQNVSVEIAAAVADITTISVNCALPIGWTYRLMDARLQLRMPVATDVEWGEYIEGQIVMFNPSTPQLTGNIPFVLGRAPGDTINPAQVDGSALPFAWIYGPFSQGAPLPNVPLAARSGTSVVRLFLASASDSRAASEISYYLQFLIYSIEEDERWALHSSVPVNF